MAVGVTFIEKDSIIRTNLIVSCYFSSAIDSLRNRPSRYGILSKYFKTDVSI